MIIIKAVKIPKEITEFCKVFKNSGYKCYLVGGAMRDYMSGKTPYDFDFTTDALPEKVCGMFKTVIPTGIAHGTVTVHYKGHYLEVTTFRTEGKYTDSRRPDSITYSLSLEEDLARRDFTVNAIAYDPITNEISDPQNGIEDIKKRLIRAIGNPEERFSEDGLRVLRACRIVAQTGFTIEENTMNGITKAANKLESISTERIRDELVKILLSPKPSDGFILMKETGILQYVLPELLEGYGVAQREMHKFDVFHHMVYATDFVEAEDKNDIIIRLAALLHDIGKPRSLEIKDGIPTFYNHDAVSAKMAEKILIRLKFSKAIISDTCHLIENHMFNYTSDWTDSAIRRIISKVGADKISQLLKLRHADRAAMIGKKTNCPIDAEFIERINTIMKKENAFSIKELAVNGNALFEKANIPKGPYMGKVLEFLLESVLEDPSLNTKEKLLEIGKKFYNSRILLS